ncbi:MAG TPA: hypothetical protein VF526_07700 [Solirubrobacteraceae bacterium]|jgi:hypothetical protein
MIASDPVNRLRAAVRESRSPLASSLGAAPATQETDDFDFAGLAATGPRARPHADEIELAVAAVHEGYSLHYGHPRAMAIDDPDLALLAGDRLYALGLERLAAIGDLGAITELADVIALSAQAHAAQDDELAHAAWQAGAVSVGWGADSGVDAAKVRARAGDSGAAPALRAAALRVRGGGGH